MWHASVSRLGWTLVAFFCASSRLAEATGLWNPILAGLASSPLHFSGTSGLSSEALDRLRREATSAGRDSDRATAAYALGVLHYTGDAGVAEDKGAALAYFRAAASAGSREGATNLGIMLEAGEGGPADTRAAFRWFTAAASKGEPEAIFRAGLMLYQGTAPDQEEATLLQRARDLFHRAAAQGHLGATHFFALLHEYGHGGSGAPDFERAAELYRRACAGIAAAAAVGTDGGTRQESPALGSVTVAAGAGVPESCYNLALLHAYGRGAEQDWGRAVLLLRQNAEGRDHGPSSFLLGRLYANGQGVPVDYEQARAFLQRAAASGDARVEADARRAFLALDGLVRRAEAETAAVLERVAEGLRPPPGADGAMAGA